MGNPAIFPLIYNGASRDVIVVHVNPIRREEIPRTAADVRDRENEIAFNSSLMREMRAIAFVARLMEEEKLDASRYKTMLIHSIMDEKEMSRHDGLSKFSADWDFLIGLRDAGRAAAEAWLDENYRHIGKKGTAPIQEMYLSPAPARCVKNQALARSTALRTTARTSASLRKRSCLIMAQPP